MELFSKYLTREAAEKTATNLLNKITNDLLANVKWLGSNIIDKIVEHFVLPDLSIIAILFRSKRVNELAGGDPGSWHKDAAAVDLNVKRVKSAQFTNSNLFYFIAQNLEFDRIIWENGTKHEPDWVHVQGKPGPLRHQIGICFRDARGKHYKYFKTIEEFNAFKSAL